MAATIVRTLDDDVAFSGGFWSRDPERDEDDAIRTRHRGTPQDSRASVLTDEVESHSKLDDNSQKVSEALLASTRRYDDWTTPTTPALITPDEGHAAMIRERPPAQTLFTKTLLFLRDKPVWTVPAIVAVLWVLLNLLTTAGLLPPAVVDALRNHAAGLVGHM